MTRDAAPLPVTTGAQAEIGRSGRRLDLLVAGVSYSSWHPSQPWTGLVWDALAASAAFAAPDARILLLGAGAGTVLTLLRRVRPAARLVAVEQDERILELAR